MATVNVLCEIGGLHDLITAGKAHLMISSWNTGSFAVGSANDETGTYYDGAVYQPSVTFTGTLTGKKAILLHDDGQYQEISLWPVSAVPNGTKFSAAAEYKEDPADDAKSTDNASGRTKSYFKYTLTY